MLVEKNKRKQNVNKMGRMEYQNKFGRLAEEGNNSYLNENNQKPTSQSNVASTSKGNGMRYPFRVANNGQSEDRVQKWNNDTSEKECGGSKMDSDFGHNSKNGKNHANKNAFQKNGMYTSNSKPTGIVTNESKAHITPLNSNIINFISSGSCISNSRVSIGDGSITPCPEAWKSNRPPFTPKHGSHTSDQGMLENRRGEGENKVVDARRGPDSFQLHPDGAH